MPRWSGLIYNITLRFVIATPTNYWCLTKHLVLISHLSRPCSAVDPSPQAPCPGAFLTPSSHPPPSGVCQYDARLLSSENTILIEFPITMNRTAIRRWISSTIHRSGAGRLASSTRPELPRRILEVFDSGGGVGAGAPDIVAVRGCGRLRMERVFCSENKIRNENRCQGAEMASLKFAA